MSLLSLRQAVVAALAPALTLPGKAVAVAAHPGRFDAGELRRCATKAPIVLVSALGASDIQDGGEVQGLCQMAAFVLCRDLPRLPRDVAALSLVERLLRAVPGNDWSGQASQAPRDLRAENLFSGELDQAGVALWAVSWRQLAVLAPGDADAGSLDWFLECHITAVFGDGSPVHETAIQLPKG